jgi:molybdopterin converting factor small subunit
MSTKKEATATLVKTDGTTEAATGKTVRDALQSIGALDTRRYYYSMEREANADLLEEKDFDKKIEEGDQLFMIPKVVGG